jgi:hypothetical protein
MNKVIVERAVQALAALNGSKRHEADSLPLRENIHESVVQPESKGLEEKAACGSPHCAGCYDAGDGRKMHPPKIGEEYRKWLEGWKPKGKPQ